MGQGLVGASAETGQPIVVPDVSKDLRYISVNPETRSELCVPLIYKDKVIGVLDLEHTRRGYFTEDHMRTVSALVRRSPSPSRMLGYTSRSAGKKSGLNRICCSHASSSIVFYPIVARSCRRQNSPLSSLRLELFGGDLYDFISYSGGQTAVAIGDVSGKGAPANLRCPGKRHHSLTCGRRAWRCTHAGGNQPVACRASYRSPVRLCRSSTPYGITTQRILQIATAVFPAPSIAIREKVERIEATGLPLGLFPSAEYDEFTFRAAPGDAFVFFSDGILDARNQHGNTFGRERAEQIVTRNCYKTADEIVTLIFDEVTDFCRRHRAVRRPERSRYQSERYKSNSLSQPRNESDNFPKIPLHVRLHSCIAAANCNASLRLCQRASRINSARRSTSITQTRFVNALIALTLHLELFPYYLLLS